MLSAQLKNIFINKYDFDKYDYGKPHKTIGWHVNQCLQNMY